MLLRMQERWNESMALLEHAFQWETPVAVGALHVAPVQPPPPQNITTLIEDVNSLDMQFYDWAIGIFERRLRVLNHLRPRRGGQGLAPSSPPRSDVVVESEV